MLFEAVEPLSKACKERGKTITIETAGTIYRELDCDLMSISPKLTSSVPVGNLEWEQRHNRDRLQPEIIQKLIDRYDYQLKFVISQLSEIEEVEDLLSKLQDVPPDRVLLMPEGRDATRLWESARSLIPEVIKRNWRLAPRLQIDLFGDTKGT